MFFRHRRRHRGQSTFYGQCGPAQGPWVPNPPNSPDPQARTGLESPNPHRLYRNLEYGKVAGVCAGVADYVGVSRTVVRLLTVIALIMFPPPTVIGYILLALIVPVRPPNLYRNQQEETFWRQVSASPERTLHALKHKRRGLEQRLRSIEAMVTSEEFQLRREFRDLGH